MPSTLPRVTKGPSIYDVLRADLDREGQLQSKDLSLPDEPARDDNTIRWAPGAADGVLGGAGGDAAETGAKVAAHLLLKATRKPSRRTLKKLYDALVDDGTVSYVDPMIEHVVAARPDSGAIHNLGVWLATTAGHRGPVKIGLALIGITGLREAGEVVRALGQHDEFTLFAAVAIRNSAESPDRDLWMLARSVDGWGRIQCVERLRDTSDPEIKEWILREGFRNSVMYEYLAYVAATTGGLLESLQRDEVDRELLTSAGQIIDALLMGGPAEDIGDLADAPELIDTYLVLLSSRAATLTDLQTATSIARFLGGGEDSDARVEHGWDEDDRARLETKAQAVLHLPLWPDVIAAGLESEDRHSFWLANAAAPNFGIDTFDLQWERLQADPLDGPWFDAWKRADSPARRERLVALAREAFPRDAIAIGGPDSMGFGPEFRAHRALDWTLQELRSHPGLGGDLVALGLLSPMTRNRNMALNALKEWPATDWPIDIERDLRRIASADGNEQTRGLALEVLDRTSSP